MTKNIPLDKKLYETVKKESDKKFDENTSIYKSSWIVREYKKRGGKYKGKKNDSGGLKRWYKEKWVDLKRPLKNGNGFEPCGREMINNKSKYPLCRPTVKVSKDTPKTVQELSKKTIEKNKKLKKSTLTKVKF